MKNLNLRRISKKIHEIFHDNIMLSDVRNCENNNLYETRALAAMAIMIKCGLDEVQAANAITDGFHDIGLDAIYLDETQKTLFLI